MLRGNERGTGGDNGEGAERGGDTEDSTWRRRRRQLLGVLSAAGVGALAGCSGGADDNGEDGEAETPAADGAPVGEQGLELRDATLSAETVTAGDELTVTATVANAGNGSVVLTVPLEFGLEEVDAARVEVPAVGERTVELASEVDVLGGVTVFVAGENVGEVTGEPPEIIHVAQDGQRRATGLEDDPLDAIQPALAHAGPGDTVHVGPGTYTEQVQTVRAGEPDAPITVTGPPEAVYRSRAPFEINHSHVHLTGLTFDGLLEPDSPENADAYSESLLQVNEALYEGIKNGDRSTDEPVTDDEYVVDVVVKPHAVGNCRADFVKVHWSRDVEVGEFEVVGPAGVKYLEGDEEGHNAEVVYVGNPIGKGYPIDETSDVHIHHIDNSEGYAHNELVDVKGGASDVVVEYCTSVGGGRFPLEGADDTSECAVHIGGRNCVLRWCVVEDSRGQAVEVGAWGLAHPDEFEETKGVDFPASAESFGRENAIYGNEFSDHAGMAVQYPVVYPEDGDGGPEVADGYGPDAQAHVCGNEIDGPTHGDPEEACSESLPTTDRIGHLGGDSPWA
jgi:hypothetical protein